MAVVVAVVVVVAVLVAAVVAEAAAAGGGGVVVGGAAVLLMVVVMLVIVVRVLFDIHGFICNLLHCQCSLHALSSGWLSWLFAIILLKCPGHYTFPVLSRHDTDTDKSGVFGIC